MVELVFTLSCFSTAPKFFITIGLPTCLKRDNFISHIFYEFPKLSKVHKISILVISKIKSEFLGVFTGSQGMCVVLNEFQSMDNSPSRGLTAVPLFTS